MARLKVMTVIGTRPEIIRLSRVIAKLDQYCDHQLVHTGQNYDTELNDVFFRDLEIRAPDLFLGAAGDSAAETIGKVIIEVDRILAQGGFDAFLVLGDTNSCLAVIPAKRRKVPIFHMEAGNRCFDQRVPEEINRRIVDHVADINLTYSSIAREYLLAEGLPADQVIKTGSPMYEVLSYYRPKIERSDALARLGLEKHRYFVVSAHREENVDEEASIRRLVEALNTLADRYREPVIVSTHPRTRKRIEDYRLELRSVGAPAQAVRLSRLRQPADERPRGALRQRDDHRGIVDPQFSGAQHPRGARAAGRHGGGGGHDDRLSASTASCRGCKSSPISLAARSAACAWLRTTRCRTCPTRSCGSFTATRTT